MVRRSEQRRHRPSKIPCTNHRPIQKHSPWQFSIPARVRTVHRDLIPLYPPLRAAFRLRMARIRLQLPPELPREEVVLIPILRHPRVGQPRQHRSPRTRIVRRQDRLPNRKHTNVRVGILPQHIFDCGRPPQARQSRRRKQYDNPYVAGRCIKRHAQLVEVFRP